MTSARSSDRPSRSGGPAPAGPNRSMWIVGAVVLVVGIALVAAIVVNRSGSSSTSSGSGGQATGSGGTVVANGPNQFGTVEVGGAALPALDDSTGTDAAVGMAAPTLKGEDFAGRAQSITNDGKPRVMMFVAHWCPHCRAEVPRIQSWLDTNGTPSDVELWTVPTSTSSTRPNYPPSDWLVGAKWTVPVLVDDQDFKAAQAYGLTSFPYFVAVGADGNVVQRASGEISMDGFAKLIDAARTGRAQPVS